MPIGITIGKPNQHKKTTLEIFPSNGDRLVDTGAEKGMDETLSDRYGLAFPARDHQVSVYRLRTNGRKAVRINGIDVEGTSPLDVQSDPDYFDKIRAVYSAARAKGTDRSNPANMTFARNQTYAIVGSIVFLVLTVLAWMLFKGPSEDEAAGENGAQNAQQNAAPGGSQSATPVPGQPAGAVPHYYAPGVMPGETGWHPVDRFISYG